MGSDREMTTAAARSDPDVIVIGAGPNGLTAAAVLAQAGLQVLVLEANETIGGAVRSGQVTRPGFTHDLFSAFYPLFPVGPIGQLPLDQYGLEWRSFEKPFAGGTPTGPAVSVHGDVAQSIESFEKACRADGDGYNRLWQLWRRGGPAVLDLLFNPIGSPAAIMSTRKLGSPARLLELAQVGVSSGEVAACRYFRGDDARVWYIGSPLHSDLSPGDAGGGLYGLVMMGLAQQVGMPIPAGGAQSITDALVRMIRRLGGEILTGHPVDRVIVRGGRSEAVCSRGVEFRTRRAILATVPPTRLFGSLIDPVHLPAGFLRAVKKFRWGSGVFKLDLALNALPAFTALGLNGAGVLHLGRSTTELRTATDQVSRGFLPEKPPLIAGIHTLADPSRAPAGNHTLWIETHVPSRPLGDGADQLTDHQWDRLREPFAERLIGELEIFAPEVRANILDYYAQTPADLESANANLVGGDIAGGSFAIDQQLVFRPVPGWFRHAMPIKGLYLGGASAHPGGGVHGAAGANAARVLLQDLKWQSVEESVRDGLLQLRSWLTGT
jgi:phytoene dehydrogenase-like protein